MQLIHKNLGRKSIKCPFFNSAFALPAPRTTPAPMMMMDRSYDFGYTADESRRVESADPSGNVVGTYAYTSPDGNQLEVR